MGIVVGGTPGQCFLFGLAGYYGLFMLVGSKFSGGCDPECLQSRHICGYDVWITTVGVVRQPRPQLCAERLHVLSRSLHEPAERRAPDDPGRLLEAVDLVVGQLLQRRHDLHVQELALEGLRALVHQVLALRLQKYQLLVHQYLVLDVVLCPLDEVPGEQLVGRLERVLLRVLL